jgi:hypothetical protein
VAIGPERTMEQDPAFAFRIIVDVAANCCTARSIARSWIPRTAPAPTALILWEWAGHADSAPRRRESEHSPTRFQLICGRPAPCRFRPDSSS